VPNSHPNEYEGKNSSFLKFFNFKIFKLKVKTFKFQVLQLQVFQFQGKNVQACSNKDKVSSLSTSSFCFQIRSDKI